MKKKNIRSLLVIAMVFYGGSALASPELSKEEVYHQARQEALHKCSSLPEGIKYSDCVQTINQAFDDMRDTFLTEANVESDIKQNPAKKSEKDPSIWEKMLNKPLMYLAAGVHEFRGTPLSCRHARRTC